MANRIVLKRSSVALKVPLAGDLVAGELAVNLTDKVLYTKDAGGNVVALGGSGGGSGTVTGVTATSPVVSSGGAAPVISMAAANTSTPGYLTAADWNTFNGKQAALGFTPYNSTNPNGYISSITSANVTTALGFTPYNSTNPSGYITSSALSSYLPLSGGTLTGNLTIPRHIGVNSLVLNTYTTVNPSSNVFLYSQPNDRDSWIYLDSADTGSNWGIYHRQIDSAVSGLPGNSIGFVGGGSSALKAYISLADGSANFAGALTQAGNQVLHAGNYTSYSPSLTGSGASGTWGINITGSSGSCSGNAATATTLATNGANFFTNNSGFHSAGSEGTGSDVRLGAAWARPGIYNGSGTTSGGNSNSITIGSEDTIYFVTQNAERGRFDSSGIGYATASFRAPIFYDQNDTGFNADLNGDSRLNSIYLNRWRINSSTGDLANDSPWYGYGLSNVGGSIGYYQGQLAHYHGLRLRAHSSIMEIDGNSYGSSWIWANTNFAVAGQNRGTIFYDYSDTSYYGDYNSQSRFNELRTIGRIYSQEWIQMDNYSGLYSPNNSAHFYPNNASYGSWRVAGSRNGWSGLEFDASNGQQSMMVGTSGTTIGWHNNSYGWKFQWEGGRMYCWDSTYGGGPQRMLLMQDTWQGTKYFGSGGEIYTTIIYDANNSGYYCDPNGTSRMNAVVADNLYAYGTVTAYYSDDRLKTRFSNIADALDKVCSLNGFFYVGNEVAESLGYKKKMEVGLSAQEVQRILPEVVVPAPVDENYLTIQYDRVVPLLVEAIKELRNELNQLKSLKV